uniref:Serpin domain-containing protein n=1 Tax=Panagrolaimus davidi TaxID=227884 RepID=A0A914P6F7_9BILA
MFHSEIPRQIDFLTKKISRIPYNIGENWKSVGIPYREHKQWMFIVMPNDKDGLENLIKQMDYAMFKECTTTSTSKCVELTIPAFEIISANYDLAKNLQGLGIIDLFDLTRCNLSKMINNLSHQQNINCYHLDKVIHKAVIKVNEYGTGAAAVTKDDFSYYF